jgi:hypothetical protein
LHQEQATVVVVTAVAVVTVVTGGVKVVAV